AQPHWTWSTEKIAEKPPGIPGAPGMPVARVRRSFAPIIWKQKETIHATHRPHRKDPRHQAREGLELEVHLRRDRRLFPDADHRGAARPDEADEAAGAIRRKAVRLEQSRGGDAQRSAVPRLAARSRADRSADLSLLRAGDGLRHH